MLVDAAAEFNCYAADVTRTYPLSASGFDSESESIYIVVQSMQTAALAMLHAGVSWEAVHLKAHEVCIEGLLALGILKGKKEDILEARTSAAFFPHGLGHYLGMDTHDSGGNPNYEDKDAFFKYLRVREAVPEGAVVTVEPGVYFCRYIVDGYLKDERQRGFIDEEVLERYWEVGGVRIEGEFGPFFLFFLGAGDREWEEMRLEVLIFYFKCCCWSGLSLLLSITDDVLITKDGYENLTTAPKGIPEIMEAINGQKSLMERLGIT